MIFQAFTVNRYFFTVFVLIITTYVCVCQEGRFVPPEVPEKYCKILNGAVLAANAGHMEESIPKIQELIEKYPTWPEPRHELARIYFDMGKKKEAILTLQASITIDTNSQLQQLYTLGRIYEDIGQFDDAILIYNIVFRKSDQQPSLKERVATSLATLESKTDLFRNDYQISLKPLPEGINSDNHEALGRWTIDGEAVIFTRLIGGQEDLYIGYVDEAGAVIKVDDFPFNTPMDEGAHTISPDEKYIIFSSPDRPGGMGSYDLYLSVFKNNEWTEPINMGQGFNSTSWDAQPVFGLDGLSIYFSSTRPGGFGGSDIWMTYEMSLGKWSKPINLGPKINTANNESSPFIHYDGRTIYFMRDGEEGLGGYDLYIARQAIDGKWMEAENMGMPINSGVDEGALSIHPDGKRAMITRQTETQKNNLFEFILPEQFQATPVQVLYAHITDKDTKKSVHARLEVFDIQNGDTLRISQWSDENGDIMITLDRNKSYGMITSAIDYVMHSTNLPADTSTVRHIDIAMIALSKAVDKPIALQNIFFETGSSKLLPSSDPELNKLVWTLRNNSNMYIEIHGHTDDVGTDEYNQQLSEDRAKAVYQYLIDRGIDAVRLSYKGFGETQPVESNETEEGRKRNRRTEFVIRRFD